ncbi:MAG: putative toxin-antitoxin system toxin component, PIN family [Pyrinomonadaceae bacterium]|nr:putative toxin-antitoxin system toxin component, PIN family [Pyrinomonadaceae bacterium]
MRLWQIVIDTNVFISALRSQFGVSYKLFMMLESGKFESNLSVSLAMEYEEVSKRILAEIKLTKEDVEEILNYVFSTANRRQVYYLWRPFLRDPKDDMVLELAVAASCEIIVTYNTKDFRGVEKFGIKTMTPLEFLREIGEIK